VLKKGKKYNLFNRIIAENFPSLKKEQLTQVQEAYRTQIIRTKKETLPRHIIIKTLSTQNKERFLKSCKT
jgi:hypothetical protein